jgi:hypothetical protein
VIVARAKRGTVAMQKPLARRLARHAPSTSPRLARDVLSNEHTAAAMPVGRKRKMLNRDTQK